MLPPPLFEPPIGTSHISYSNEVGHARNPGGTEWHTNFMSEKTQIEWTGRTWNPIGAFLKVDIKVGNRTFPAGTRGWFCVKVSPGCANCYAEGINLRLGNGLGYVKVNLDQIEWRMVNLEDPLRWKNPQMCFVDSMSDLFFEAIPDELIDQVFAVMALASRHTFQVLTKRAVRMRDYLRGCDNGSHIWTARPRIINRMAKFAKSFGIPKFPLPNVWLGVSVEDQERADQRIPKLLDTPAAIRFLSCEPLLGPLHLRVVNATPFIQIDALERGTFTFSKIDWAIVGGESGPRARLCDIEWIRNIVGDCQATGVPVFVKQMGRLPIECVGRSVNPERPLLLKDKKGGDPAEWPADLRVREMPGLKLA